MERTALSSERRPRLLLVAADCDGEDVSEAYNAFKWVTELSKVCEVTLLTEYNRGRRPPSEQIQSARVIDWERPVLLNRAQRFNSAAKPGYIGFYVKVRKQIKRLLEAGDQFDVLHQLTPNAIRYPTVCCGFGIPYIVGPKAGGLPTPKGFVAEIGSAPWYTHLRALDGARLRFDPLLRRSYSDAAVVVGAAPYVQELLSPVHIQRFAVEFDAGIDDIAPIKAPRHQLANNRSLRLLHVGRAVRTKGLRDVVRAIGRCSETVDVTLTVAGDGEELEICRREAEALNLANRIFFLGRLRREEVERLYEEADIFIYPSFREPGGGVVLEAMRYGLPVITSDIGGPGHVVTDESGIRLSVRNPGQLAGDLASAIERLAANPSLLESLGAGARARVAEIGLWDGKIERMMRLYRSILAPVPSAARVGACSPGDG